MARIDKVPWKKSRFLCQMNYLILTQVCDVVTINCPLHPETEGLFNKEMIGKMKRGAYIVNTARGKICDR
jgi:lactate dehydrogenase-like 2-hydroxyacid dehydrogenase